jgi:hypothetical protein
MPECTESFANCRLTRNILERDRREQRKLQRRKLLQNEQFSASVIEFAYCDLLIPKTFNMISLSIYYI